MHWQVCLEVEMKGAGWRPGAGGSHGGIAGYQSYHPAPVHEPQAWQCELHHPGWRLPWNGDPAWAHWVLNKELQHSKTEQLRQNKVKWSLQMQETYELLQEQVQAQVPWWKWLFCSNHVTAPVV
jgi:hypothetical protein